MGPPVRERYNSKARGSSAKKGKPKKTAVRATVGEDPNVEVLVPKSTEAKEDDRKQKIKAELVAASQTKMSSKKKRRLDSYIDKKLKKEERQVLFKKLAVSQGDNSSMMNLHSSSALGSGKLISGANRLATNEDKHVRRALDGRDSSRKRKRPAVVEEEEDFSDGEEDFDAGDVVVERAQPTPIASTSRNPSPTRELSLSPVHSSLDKSEANVTPVVVPKPAPVVAVGSALKRNADGTIIQPRFIPKKSKAEKKLAFAKRRSNKPATEDEASDEESEGSFDSSASEDDDEEEEDHSAGDDSSDEDEGDGDEDEIMHSDSEPPATTNPRKRTNFKEWAQKQIDASKGYDESTITQTTSENLLDRPVKPKEPASSDPVIIRGPLGEDLKLPSTSFAAALEHSAATAITRKHVTVTRDPEIQAARLLLPVVSEEQAIVEAIRLNPVVVICGETGSGKTTQVPQFLFEAGFGSPGSDNPGMIGITQPRRVAAMSMASRVATELSLPPSRVSYQIRYDATVSPSTSIKFMTDGVLLRELATDFLLSKYSVIIVDEAHERSMNTDILIGVLSRVMKLREDLWKKNPSGDAKPLRLIIMSATLRVSDFAENKTLFPTIPPIINISSRQHPVTIHFSRRTQSDYVTEAVRKATKIHARLPVGGILIFLTGQAEITTVCRKLEKKFGKKALEEKKKRQKERGAPHWTNHSIAESDDKALVPVDMAKNVVRAEDGDVEVEELDIGLDAVDYPEDGEPEGQIDPDGLDTDEEDDGLSIDTDQSDVPMHIIPLYSLLTSEHQMRVFQPPPLGTRLVVVATNVAETSLTIPGIRYVIDCGRAKQRQHSSESGIQTFQVGWISKASASQRAGRAGRTGPGHCYRLYSSALYENHLDKFSEPEILRVPIEGVVLQMKSMHIDAVANFPFPTPPDRISLKSAETVLTYLGALAFGDQQATKSKISLMSTITGSPSPTIGGHITDLGKAMSLFPVSPRFSKMLVAGRQDDILPYVIAIVSALSIGDPFLREDFLHDNEGGDEDNDTVKDNDSIAASELKYIKSADIRAKELRKLERQRFFKSQQLHSKLGGGSSDVFRTLSVVGAYEYAGGGATFCSEHYVRMKAMEDIHKLRAQISNIVRINFPSANAGFSPKLPPPNGKQIKVLRQLLTSGFIDRVAVRKDLVTKTSDGTKFASSRGIAYQAMGVSEDVFIHPSSALFHASPPEYVVFQELVRTSRVWLKTITIINPSWLPTLGRSLCTFSKPKTVPTSMQGATVVTPRFGPDAWELPPVKL